MFVVFLIMAVIGVIALMFYLVVELNELEKRTQSLVEKIRAHYENG